MDTNIKRDFMDIKHIIRWKETTEFDGWYHTIQFEGGETDGIYNHLPIIDHYHFPKDLSGKRCLDVACGDGFFSFLFEKLGASEVIGLDLYREKYFKEAADKLKSKCIFCKMDALEINENDLGKFDFIFCGSFLLHISDPITLLNKISKLLKEDGLLVATNNVCLTRWYHKGIRVLLRLFSKSLNIAFLAPYSSKRAPAYWIPTSECFLEMFKKAGFKSAFLVDIFDLVANTPIEGKKLKSIQTQAVVHARLLK